MGSRWMGHFDFVIVTKDKTGRRFHLLGVWDGKSHWTSDVNQAMRCTSQGAEAINRGFGLGGEIDRGFK